jgi:hypothetical protein
MGMGRYDVTVWLRVYALLKTAWFTLGESTQLHVKVIVIDKEPCFAGSTSLPPLHFEL